MASRNQPTSASWHSERQPLSAASIVDNQSVPNAGCPWKSDSKHNCAARFAFGWQIRTDAVLLNALWEYDRFRLAFGYCLAAEGASPVLQAFISAYCDTTKACIIVNPIDVRVLLLP